MVLQAFRPSCLIAALSQLYSPAISVLSQLHRSFIAASSQLHRSHGGIFCLGASELGGGGSSDEGQNNPAPPGGPRRVWWFKKLKGRAFRDGRIGFHGT